MSRQLQIMRDGEVIGQHDEAKVLTLLNAGALRLTDTCWHRSMSEPKTLAVFLSDRDRKHSRFPLIVVALALLVGLIALAWHHAMPRSNPALVASSAGSVASSAAGDGYEIRRGVPVIVGSIGAAREMEPPFPLAKVQPIAAHGRVTVVALDEQQQPFSVGAGVVISDGAQAVCALTTLAGAKQVEVRFDDGHVERPGQGVIDGEAGIVILRLKKSGVPVRLCSDTLSEHDRVWAAGHVLGAHQEGWIARVAEVERGERRVTYALESALPLAASGSALINEAGDVAAVLVDAIERKALRAADVLAVMQKGKAQSLAMLASMEPSMQVRVVDVPSASVEEGSLIASLRNTSGVPVHGALLHVTYFATPPEVTEMKQLEDRLRALAVQAGEIVDDASDQARANRQALREVNAKIESAQQRLQAAMNESAKHPHRQDFHVIACDLPPGIPQTVQLDVNAGSQWSARVVVLDVDA